MHLSTEMDTRALVALYNERAPKPISAWKGKKEKLIEKIRDLPEPAPIPAVELDADEYAAAIVRTAISPRDSIQVASEKLLEAVAYEHDGRKWGIPYNLILDEVRRVFPDCSTTVACLRWYAVRMNEHGAVLPKRKRSKR